MATHSSVFAWRIPGTREPVGLPSMGSHRVRHNWSDLAAGGSVVKNPPANSGNPSLIPGSGRSPGEGNGFLPGKSHGERSMVGYGSWSHKRVGRDLATKTARHPSMRAFLVSLVRNPPAMQQTQARSLGREDHLEEEMATHPSILPGKIPWTRGAWQATVHGVAKSLTQLSMHTCILIQLLNKCHHLTLQCSSLFWRFLPSSVLNSHCA